MIPPIPTRQGFIRMLDEPAEWLNEAIDGLSAAELDATPRVGKWSCRQQLLHVVEADLGWTDILYRAVRPQRPALGVWDPNWRCTFDQRIAEGGLVAALTVLHDNHVQVGHWLMRMSDDDFLASFPGVLWLADAGLRVVIADSGRWGLYLHPYHHLAYVQRLRDELGRPAPALQRFLQRAPGFLPTAPWPPWTNDIA